MANFTRVFVYGTLKRGFPNHKLLSDMKDGTAKFLSVAKTDEQFPLVVTSSAFIPFLLDCPGTGENIQGEIYEVCEKTLEKLDDLESVGILYDRKIISVILCDKNINECIQAHAYMITNYKKNLLDLPLISNYNNEHAQKYKPKAERGGEDIAKQVKT